MRPCSQAIWLNSPYPTVRRWRGEILEIEAENIRVDFNHPLADLPIEFEVEIMQFHEALTPESGADA